MPLTALRDDALRSTPDGFSVRLSLPWIRSLPLASLVDVRLTVGDAVPRSVLVRVGEREITPSALAFERGWWFVQDRVVLRSRGALTPGTHDVTVAFGLLIPYLAVGPDGPLRLPFRFTRPLEANAALPINDVARDAA